MIANTQPLSGIHHADLSTDRPRLRKAAALLEVLGIFTVGQLLGFLLGQLLGIPLQNPLLGLTVNTTPAELFTMTQQLLGVLLLQYAGWFLLILPIGWWYRRRTPAQYGITKANHSFISLVAMGVVLFAFAQLPTKLLDLANSLVPLGESIPWREALFQMDWSTVEFWLLMAVGSFALVPIFEELFYRGYCQRRLEEDFGAPTAILAVAAFFALSHSQYYLPNVLNIGTLLALIFSVVGYGYIFYRTRSLVPVITAHALVNFPVRGIGLWVELVLMVIVCIIARRQIATTVREFIGFVRGESARWQMIMVVMLLALTSVLAVLVGDVMILLGIVFLIAALVLEVIVKRRARKVIAPLNDGTAEYEAQGLQA
jgi:membrane protease YdiL (CAAX protease family)